MADCSPAAEDVQAAFAAVLVDEWARSGVTDAVVSPGSRSTPLLVALAERVGALRLHVVLDERSAGFIAVGLGRATRRPAVVVTTSGTAAAELHAAVMEADEGGVPLIAVTADRPAELHDCGATQTVRQVGLFGRAVRWEQSPGVPDLAASASWRSMAARAVAEAVGGAHRPGPVHLNLAFRDPLIGSAKTAARLSALVGRPDGSPWHRAVQPEELPARPEIVNLLAATGKRGLIVAGAGCGDPDAVWQLARAMRWPVLAEPLSGCRWPGAIGAADSLLRSDRVRAWRPEIVLRLGDPWLSKVLGGWLADLDCPQVLVDRWGTWAAPDRQQSFVVTASPSALCRQVTSRAPISSAGGRAGDRAGDWAGAWCAADEVAQEAIDAELAGQEDLSEPALARSLVRWAPQGSTFVLSSSMPARDVEWWSQPRVDVRFVSNRGANGIDGALSTSVGVALAGRSAGAGRCLALLGDLAFVYDCSALASASKLGAPLDVVVVDNDGGGIFNFLPQATLQPPDRFERLWGTPHGADLCRIAEGYGVEVSAARDVSTLLAALDAPSKGPSGLRVIVVKTERSQNVGAHERLHAAVSAAVERLVGAGAGAGDDGPIWAQAASP